MNTWLQQKARVMDAALSHATVEPHCFLVKVLNLLDKVFIKNTLFPKVGLREVVRVDMVEVCITSLQHVPGITTTTEEPSMRAHTVWMGTHSHRYLPHLPIMFSP